MLSVVSAAMAAARPGPPCASATTAAARRSCSARRACSPQRGYDQTSMPELAEALGLAAGSLYHYFGGKEQLLRAICDQLMEPLLERARGAARRAARAGGPAARARARCGSSTSSTHRDHMLVFQQERHVIERGAAWRAVRASRKASSGSPRTRSPRGGGPAGPLRRPPARAVRAARHGQPHGAVVPPARARGRGRDRRRLRGPSRQTRATSRSRASAKSYVNACSSDRPGARRGPP